MDKSSKMKKVKSKPNFLEKIFNDEEIQI